MDKIRTTQSSIISSGESCKKNESIELNFLLTEHTKFSPDRNFGIVKTKFAKSVVDCHEDFIDVINTSSPNKFNIAVPSKDPRTKNRNVFWAGWDRYLQQFFKPIPNISKYHHFKFYPDGSIKAKFLADSEEVELRKASPFNAEGLPLHLIEPEGISAQRAWYLYKEIRPLCYKDSSKDLLAPKPNFPEVIAKPKTLKKTSEDSNGLKEIENTQKTSEAAKVGKPKTSRAKKSQKSSKDDIDKQPKTSRATKNNKSSEKAIDEKQQTSKAKKNKNSSEDLLDEKQQSSKAKNPKAKKPRII